MNHEDHLFPLKINEYLAAGKPCHQYRLCRFGRFQRDGESMYFRIKDFIEGIAKEIRYNNRLKISKRIAFARTRTVGNPNSPIFFKP